MFWPHVSFNNELLTVIHTEINRSQSLSNVIVKLSQHLDAKVP